MRTLKSFIPQTLLARALLIVVLPVVLVQVVSTYIFFDRHWDNVTRHMSRGLSGEMAFVIYQMQHLLPEERKDFLRELARHTDINARFRGGAHINKSASSKEFAAFHDNLQRLVKVPFIIERNHKGGHVLVSFALDDGVLELEASVKRLDSRTTIIYMLWMGGSAIFFITIALVFLRNQIRPIRRLAEAAESFGRGKDMADFRPSGALEVRRAAKAFIVMRERIKRQLRTRSEMLSGISHDLRTPISRMKLQLEMLPDSEATQGLKSDVTQMQHMIDEYLDFARGQGREETIRLPSEQVLREIVENHHRAGHEVTLDIRKDVAIEIRHQAFARMMGNLIDNAIHYGKRCHITADVNGDYLELYVDDEGEGIPPDKYETVFKPFTRLDPSRGSEAGVGLGLSIARDVAMAHGGSIFLTTAPGGGLRVIVRIPT